MTNPRTVQNPLAIDLEDPPEYIIVAGRTFERVHAGFGEYLHRDDVLVYSLRYGIDPTGRPNWQFTLDDISTPEIPKRIAHYAPLGVAIDCAKVLAEGLATARYNQAQVIKQAKASLRGAEADLRHAEGIDRLLAKARSANLPRRPKVPGAPQGRSTQRGGMTKDVASKMFRRLYPVERYRFVDGANKQRIDEIARKQDWGIFLDSLCKEGRITLEQYQSWDTYR